ncbi:hypothetical protein KCU61_g505, partial [Aureobasidium melanogenum]
MKATKNPSYSRIVDGACSGVRDEPSINISCALAQSRSNLSRFCLSAAALTFEMSNLAFCSKESGTVVAGSAVVESVCEAVSSTEAL